MKCCCLLKDNDPGSTSSVKFKIIVSVTLTKKEIKVILDPSLTSQWHSWQQLLQNQKKNLILSLSYVFFVQIPLLKVSIGKVAFNSMIERKNTIVPARLTFPCISIYCFTGWRNVSKEQVEKTIYIHWMFCQLHKSLIK